MSDTAVLRARLRAALLAPLAGASLALGCEEPRMPTCPSGYLCTHASQVAPIARVKALDLGCPTELVWADDGGAPPVHGLTRFGEATLDHDATQKQHAAGTADACCYHYVEPCPGGRPLLEGGRALLPDVVAAEHDAPARSAGALAAAWLADARAEHASIASFARAAIELLAVGAPLDLVAATQRASLDEVRHAERCFALASRYAGRTLAPGALPAAAPRAASLAQVARDTFEEGCVGETLAALAAGRALAACEDEAVRDVLAGIAEDEAAHAALAWRTVAWAVRSGGSEARDAVRAAADELGRRILDAEEQAEGGDAQPGLARHGRLDHEAQRRAQRDAWREIVEPMLTELLVG